MKNFLKKILICSSVLGVVAIMGGCSSDSDKGKNVEYVQTHQDDEITSIHAKMYQKNGNKDKMGTIKFSETDSGLKMAIDLKDVRPNTEYKLYVFEVKGCDVKKDKKDMAKKCTKTQKNIDMPMLTGDRNGKIDTTYMITGLTAADLDGKKLVLARDDASGKEVHVGWGLLSQGMWF